MNDSVDYIIDRNRIRRKLTFWRITTIIVILLAIGTISATTLDDEFIYEDHIARIYIEGPIIHDTKMIELIDEVEKDEKVKAVVFVIDSPGGTTLGGETLYKKIMELNQTKPSVASINTLGTSAAYMAAIASQYIVAHQTSIVGSIGVIFQYPQIDKLLENWGIKVKEIKSAPLKAAPSLFAPDDPKANEMIQEMINDTFIWFKNIVAEQRRMSKSQIDRIADGSVYTGSRALQNQLIDEIGGEEIAVKWLKDTYNIDKDIEVITREISYDETFEYFTGTGIIKKWINKNIVLDGLVSIWQK